MEFVSVISVGYGIRHNDMKIEEKSIVNFKRVVNARNKQRRFECFIVKKEIKEEEFSAT